MNNLFKILSFSLLLTGSTTYPMFRNSLKTLIVQKRILTSNIHSETHYEWLVAKHLFKNKIKADLPCEQKLYLKKENQNQYSVINHQLNSSKFVRLRKIKGTEPTTCKK